MSVLEIIGLILGSGGIGSFITWAISLKSEKRIKESEAIQSEQITENMIDDHNRDWFDQMYVQVTKMMQDYNDLSDEYRHFRQDAINRERNFQNKVDTNCQELASLKSQIQYLKGLRCYNTTCQNRIKLNPEKQE